jgi:integrase
MTDTQDKAHMKDNIIKRGNSYAAAVYTGRDENGKKHYKWVSAKSKPEVRDKLVKLKGEVRGGTYTDPKGTVGEYMERWLREYAKNLAPRTYEGYQSIYRSGIKPAFGSVMLKDLRPERIQKYYPDKQDAGDSPTTLRHHHMMLHRAFEHAVKWQVLGRNPVDAVEPPPVRQVEMHTLNARDAVAFLKAAQKTTLGPVFHLALYTGMRRSEIMALRWQDVDLAQGKIYVTRTVHQLHNPSRIIFRGTKTKRSTRLIDLVPATVEVLTQHLENHKALCARVGGKFANDRLLFCQFDTETQTWEPLKPDRVGRAWSSLIEKLGYAHVRFHDARHTHASLLLKQGTHMKIVQERLGHATISTTMDIYSHVAPGMQKQAAEAFGAMMQSCASDGLADGLADRPADDAPEGQEVGI